VAVGVYPMRIARYVTDANGAVNHAATNGHASGPHGASSTNGTTSPAPGHGALGSAEGLPIYAERTGNPH